MKVNGYNVYCKHIIRCGKSQYDSTYMVVIFTYAGQELYWSTTSKTKAACMLKEGEYYDLSWIQEKDMISHVKLLH